MTVALSTFSNSQFDSGAGPFKEALWVIASLLFFRLCPISISPLKRAVLRAFVAKIGVGVTG